MTAQCAAAAVNDVLDGRQRWAGSAPPELWTNLVLTGGPAVQCRVGGCHAGGESGLVRLLNAVDAAKPAARTVRGLNYLGAMNHYAGGGRRQTFAGASRIITSPVAGADLTSMMEGRLETDLLIDSMDGAVADVVGKLAAAGATGGYVNYIDRALPDWMTACYGDNAARLKKVAQAHDPDNVFHFGQSIQA